MDAITGRVMLPGEPAADLVVRLEVEDGHVSLRTETADLGRWPRAAVRIVRMSEGAFSLSAEGERLTFLPDDADALGRLEIVTEYAPPPTHPKKKRRRTRSKPAGATPGPGLTAADIRAGRVTPPERRPPEPKPRTTQSRSVAPRAAADRAAMRARATAARSLRAARGRLAGPRRPRPKLPAVSPETKRKMAAASAAGMGWTRRRLRLGWLWALDHLRQTDIYGLDRIPVVTDEMRLEADHVHTFESRIAGAGLSRRVCTDCGKVVVTND